MSVKEIMTHRPFTLGMDRTLADIKALFDRRHIHHVLVIEQEKLVGVVSDRDLLKHLSPALGTAAQTTKDLATLNKKAHQIMSRDLKVLYEKDDILDAIRLFNEHSISCLPVVNDKFHPIGIVSWRDVLKTMTKAIS